MDSSCPEYRASPALRIHKPRLTHPPLTPIGQGEWLEARLFRLRPMRAWGRAEEAGLGAVPLG